jgi:TonB family protein
MREELQMMELVDRYLDGAMGNSERAAFQERMGSNAGLGLLVNDQRALREGLLRVHLRHAAVVARRIWIFKRLLPWITMGALLLGTAAYVVLGSAREGRGEEVAHIDATTPPMEFMVTVSDSAAPCEGEELKVETVFVEQRMDSLLMSQYVRIEPVGTTEKHAPVANSSGSRKEQMTDGSVAFDVRTLAHYGATADSIEATEATAPICATVKPLLATVEQPGNADQQPSYPGGWDAMHDFLKANLRVPRNLRESRTVLVSFVVDRKGEIRDAKVVESGSTKLDNEALRVIALMPRWVPCKVGDKPVKSRIEVPIRFGGDGMGVEK